MKQSHFITGDADDLMKGLDILYDKINQADV